MKIKIDHNDINKRLSLLYRASDKYLNNHKVIRPEIISTEITQNETGQTIQINIGKIINQEEELDIVNQINELIHQIGKLKDHTINSLKRSGIQERRAKNIVNNYINENLPLAIITDFDNQEKHEYPATKFIRSNLHPIVENIRYEIEPNFNFGWTNIFSEGQMVIEADVVDKDGNNIFSFRNLISEAIELWENFYLLNVNELSSEIQSRTVRKGKWNEKYEDFLKRENYSMKETIQINNWKAVKSENLQRGMLLKVFDKESKKQVFGGVAIDKFNEKDSTQIVIKNVFLNGDTYRFSSTDYLWMIFASGDIEKNERVYKYYYELVEMKEAAVNKQFGNE